MTIKEILNEQFAMTLDELIAALQEAKEHAIDGRSKILLQNDDRETYSYILNVEYDSNKVIINYG